MAKTVIITGCSSGIGLATTKSALAAGYNVFGVDVSNEPEGLGSSFKFLQEDLTKPSAAPDVVAGAKSAFESPLYGLLNVAGIVDSMQSVDTFDDAQWDRVMAINLTAPVKMMRAFVKAIKEDNLQGAIVNVASAAALSGGTAGIAYTASKSGLVGATRQTAFRFKSEGIRCNAICPGAVPSTNISQSFKQNLMDMNTMKMLNDFRVVTHPDELHLQPEAIAGLLTYLLSDASKGINGAVIPIDNGWNTA